MREPKQNGWKVLKATREKPVRRVTKAYRDLRVHRATKAHRDLRDLPEKPVSTENRLMKLLLQTGLKERRRSGLKA